MSSQEFISILKEEFQQHKSRAGTATESANQAGPYRRSLANRIAKPPTASLSSTNVNTSQKCQQCGLTNHKTQDCRHLGASKCDDCGRFGHATKDCWGGRGNPKCRKTENASTAEKTTEASSNKLKRGKKKKQEQMNATIEEVHDEEHITFAGNEEKLTVPAEITTDAVDNEQAMDTEKVPSGSSVGLLIANDQKLKAAEVRGGEQVETKTNQMLTAADGQGEEHIMFGVEVKIDSNEESLGVAG
jgi:hypothetical protein